MAADPGVRKTVTLLLVLVGLVLALTWGRQIWLADDGPGEQSPAALQKAGVLVFPEPQPIDPFTLLDQDGTAVSRDDLRGQWTLAFLGYSRCRQPQCEHLFETLGRFAAELETAAPEFWYLSVDPDRDSPEALREHLQGRDLEVRGLTGEPDELRSLAADLKGAFNRAASNGAKTDPAAQASADIEFSDHLGLVSPDGSLVAIAQQPLDIRALAEAYRQLIADYGSR